MKPIVALAGRPNTGKTTLFNALTGLRQRVANFAGCTVEKAVGIMEFDDDELEIVDLPGTFSIIAATQDEQVSFNFLSEASATGAPLHVLCVAEASNLENDLVLALSLHAAGYPVSLIVNMADEAAANGVQINAARLEAETALPVLLTSARYGRGLEAVETHLRGINFDLPTTRPADLRAMTKNDLAIIHEKALHRAHEIVACSVRLPPHTILPMISRAIAIDRLLFHPIAGPLILAATMFFLFQSLFAWARPLMDVIASACTWFSNALRPLIRYDMLASLLCDGIIAGISAVATFLPQIAILFTLIGFLEQSGYLPRAGAMVDRALRPFGLDGRVFIPFLSSFACAIPGIMATRTIPNEKRRLTALLLCPLMTCSARIPVYTLIITAFVPASAHFLGFNAQGIVMAGMYLFGVVMALVIALGLRRTRLYEVHPSPVAVLPPYRFPKPQELAHYVWIRCWHFLSKAGKIIFTVSIALWFLASFPRNPAIVPMQTELAALPLRNTQHALELKAHIGALTIEHSLLGHIGRGIEPVFRPIGYDWILSVAIIASLAAREVFVGTLGTLFALNGGPGSREGLVVALRAAQTPTGAPRYTLATAVSLLIFFAIALQCISTIAIVRRETGGWKWPAIQFTTFFVIAYTLAWAGYQLTLRLIV